METLLALYKDKFKEYEGTIHQVFSKFYTLDLSPIDSWLESRFNDKVEKNNSASKFYRVEGNSCYKKKDLMGSLEFFTKSLCYATPSSEEYALALGNRTAVFFEIKDFENCLKDVDRCLNTDYPADLRPKIYNRKALCYFETAQEENFKKSVMEFENFLSSGIANDKENHFGKLRKLKIEEMKQRNLDPDRDDENKLPEFIKGENVNFVNASSKLKISYDQERGRHVVAKESIQRGDILFIEKAFVFAPIFEENKTICSFKCYNCLKNTLACIPCRSCTLCVYCDETCRTLSWDGSHKWECEGMQANIWYDLGIVFPALRAALKGATNGFVTLAEDPVADVKTFGDHCDNYPYFNKLCSNLTSQNKNFVAYLTMAAVVVVYLKRYTGFFTWLLQRKYFPSDDIDRLVFRVGGLIAKHIAQMACNSSVIEHWTCSSTDKTFPNDLRPVACGIFPSVSMMNHSCRPNITNFFIGDTIVVKALEDISVNQEVFNCYGIDYRSMTREQRQLACQELYGFTCKCTACAGPSSEMHMFDSYLCSDCKGPVPDVPYEPYSSCVNCKKKYRMDVLRKYNFNSRDFTEDSGPGELKRLMKRLELMKMVLYKHHTDFGQIYFHLYMYHFKRVEGENTLRYFRLWLKQMEARRGKRSRSVGVKLLEEALTMFNHFIKNRHEQANNFKSLLENIEDMVEEAKSVLNLYYPDNIINGILEKNTDYAYYKGKNMLLMDYQLPWIRSH